MANRLVFDPNVGEKVKHTITVNREHNEIILQSTESDHFVKISKEGVTNDNVNEVLNDFLEKYEEANDRVIVTAEQVAEQDQEDQDLLDAIDSDEPEDEE